MRAVAVMLVLLDHVGLAGFGGGYVGVDVFFVLSGFLITGLLLDEARNTGTVSLGRFYMGRARRILPAALLTLVATDVASYFLINIVRAKEAIDDSIWTAVFAANVHFAEQATNYFDRSRPPSPLLHYWTLAVEEQFYLLWPAIIGAAFFVGRLVKRSGIVLTAGVASIVTASSLAWSVHDTNADPRGAYFSTFARAWELGLGALLSLAVPALSRAPRTTRATAGWAGLAGIMCAVVAYGGETRLPGSAALLPAAGTALLIAAGLGSHARIAVGRLLSSPPLGWLGDRSYAVYLWHWPILILAAEYEGRPVGSLSLPVKLVLVAVAVALSAVTYALFENPIRRRRWSAHTAVVVWPASVAASLAVAFLLLHLVDSRLLSVPAARAGTPVTKPATDTTLPAVRTAAGSAERGAPIPSPLVPAPTELVNDHYQPPDGCAAGNGRTSSETCFLGDTSHCAAAGTATGATTSSPAGPTVTSCPPAAGRKLIVVLGDSHAEMWMPAIIDMAAADGWTVLLLSKSACTPDIWATRPLQNYSGPPSWRECHSWYRWATGSAKALKPTAEILAGAYGRGPVDPYTRSVVAGMGTAATEAKRYAKAVILIGDTPAVAHDPTDCLLHPGNTLRNCATTYPQNLWTTDGMIAARATAAHASFLSTRGWFCYRAVCPMVVGHTVVYRDSRDTAHITTAYAQLLAVPFRTAIEHLILDQLTG